MKILESARLHGLPNEEGKLQLHVFNWTYYVSGWITRDGETVEHWYIDCFDYDEAYDLYCTIYDEFFAE